MIIRFNIFVVIDEFIRFNDIVFSYFDHPKHCSRFILCKKNLICGPCFASSVSIVSKWQIFCVFVERQHQIINQLNL